jgi:chromosome segregation ATPase
MAAQSPSSHKRTDSGVGGTGPVADTLATAQSFCTVVVSLTSEHGFQAINELVKSVPQRELEIKIRDETIRDLRDELAGLQKERDVFNGQQLSTFEHRYEKWKVENTVLQKEIEELEAALEENDSKLITLQSQLGDVEARVDDLEKENTHLTTKVKERGQQLGSFEARLQRAQADLDERAEEIKEANNRTNTLQDSFDNEANQHRVLREEANKIRLRLKDFIQFSVKIAELDLPDV